MDDSHLVLLLSLSNGSVFAKVSITNTCGSTYNKLPDSDSIYVDSEKMFAIMGIICQF